MTWVTTFLFVLLGIVVLALTCVLIATLWPRWHPFSAAGRTNREYREQEIENGVVFDQNYPSRPVHFEMDDGARIAAREIGPADARDLIVMVHGIGAAGERWNNPCGLLSEATGAKVVALALRGHNESSGPRYDLERIGQYEDDIAQVISALRSARPDARIWLAGHSMGGGIALRYALKPNRPQVTGYILFAPLFGPGPTAHEAPSTDAVLRIDRARVIGLMLLNKLGLRVLNHLPVAYLNAPPDFPAYSFTALASVLPLPPKTATDALQAMEGPFIVIAGEDDATLRAQGYREVVGNSPQGTVKLLPGHGHDSLLNDQETHAMVAQWIERCCPEVRIVTS